MVNQPPHHIMFSKERVIEYGESLNKVVAWAYFNRLLTAETHLHLISQNIDQLTLRNFVADLRLFFRIQIAKFQQMRHFLHSAKSVIYLLR